MVWRDLCSASIVRDSSSWHDFISLIFTYFFYVLSRALSPSIPIWTFVRHHERNITYHDYSLHIHTLHRFQNENTTWLDACYELPLSAVVFASAFINSLLILLNDSSSHVNPILLRLLLVFVAFFSIDFSSVILNLFWNVKYFLLQH